MLRHMRFEPTTDGDQLSVVIGTLPVGIIPRCHLVEQEYLLAVHLVYSQQEQLRLLALTLLTSKPDLVNQVMTTIAEVNAALGLEIPVLMRQLEATCPLDTSVLPLVVYDNEAEEAKLDALFQLPPSETELSAALA